MATYIKSTCVECQASVPCGLCDGCPTIEQELGVTSFAYSFTFNGVTYSGTMYVNSVSPCSSSSDTSYVYVQMSLGKFDDLSPCAYDGIIWKDFDGGGFCSGQFTINSPVSLPFTVSGFNFYCQDSYDEDASITFS